MSTTGKKSFESDRKRKRGGTKEREKKMEAERDREKKKISGPQLNSVDMEYIFI